MTRVEELSGTHLNLLRNLSETFWDGTTAADLVCWILDGTVQAWDFDEAPDALVLTQIQNHRAGRELVLYGIVGAGILREAQSVTDGIKALAKELECKWIGAEADSKAWRWINRNLRGIDFKPESVKYLAEI